MLLLHAGYNMGPGMRKPGAHMYTKYTYSCYSKSFPYYINFKNC